MAGREDGARSRLLEAGLQLFRERGFDRTTAAEIAARANLTERTFFRLFKDKREVLFDGESLLRDALLESVGTAPDGLAPIATLFRAFRSVLPIIEGNRAFAEPRQAVIAETPALQERELAKHASLADALAEALEARGTPPRRAYIAARASMAPFVYATAAWLDSSACDLGRQLDAAEEDLKVIAGDRID